VRLPRVMLKPPRGRVETHCAHCKRAVLVKPSTAASAKRIYCGDSCRTEAGKQPCVCDHCGKRFTRRPSVVQNTSFCSRKCYNDSPKRHMRTVGREYLAPTNAVEFTDKLDAAIESAGSIRALAELSEIPPGAIYGFSSGATQSMAVEYMLPLCDAINYSTKKLGRRSTRGGGS
jgi:hypothetical protein